MLARYAFEDQLHEPVAAIECDVVLQDRPYLGSAAGPVAELTPPPGVRVTFDEPMPLGRCWRPWRTGSG